MGDQLQWRRKLKALEKSALDRMRRAKQRESHTDHRYHCSWKPQPEIFRQGLGTETWDPEVSSRERTRAGCVETA